jgi:murein DD-endopeptidase MepM/ murein hydrolase activator NlpD
LEALAYPLQINTIRRNSDHHTFGMVRNHHHRAHQGWDLLATPLTPCYAIADGQVVRAGPSANYGKMILLEFEFRGTTYFAAYCHLSFVLVKVYDRVSRGDMIGRTGNTGNAATMRGQDQHLHFEIRTTVLPGRGVADRVNPADLYGTTPLQHSVYQRRGANLHEIGSRPGFKVPGVNILD